MDLVPGTLVTPTVRLVEPLDHGGMGAVWVADHLALDTQVAVKFIAEHAESGRRRAIERFKREASLAAKLKSPHAVRVYDHGFIDGATPFIVMELLEGRSLRAELATRVLGLDEVSVIVSQVADVLTEAHALGIVHRDIKPENLFLIRSSYDIFVKVLDFGIAKDTRPEPEGDLEPPTRALADHDATRTGAMLGTPRYASPELIECAKDATLHADLWSLAVVAYEALVGEAPFVGDSLGALCVAISKAKFDAPSAKREALSPRVDAWFLRALAPLPDERFPTARAMAEALTGLVSESVAVPLLEPEREVPPVASRRRWQTVIAAAALMAAGAGSWAYLRRAQAARASETAPSTTTSPAAPVASSSPVIPAHDLPVPAHVEASAAAVAPRPAPQPVRPPKTPRAAASGTGSCLAYDAASKRWIYTCATE